VTHDESIDLWDLLEVVVFSQVTQQGILLIMWEDRSHKLDLLGGGLVYVQVANDIATMIEAGELSHGAKLPGEQELAQIYGIARVTIRRAMQELRERGLVVTAHGRGSFVL